MADSLNFLAELYREQGRYKESEKLAIKSLQIREAAHGPDHQDVAISLNNLAMLYNKAGRYEEAEAFCERATRIMEKSLGKSDPKYATSLNNLGLIYSSQGLYQAAEKNYIESLKIRERVQGPDHPVVATSLNNLANVYDDQGRYNEAEPLFLRSLKIREKKLGQKHPSVATSLNNLAAFYSNQGRNVEAKRLYQRSLKIYEAAYGPDHPLVATSLNNLAALFQYQGRYDEAEPYFQRSLKIVEKALGAHHPDVAAGLNNLAELYKLMRRYDEVEPLLQRSHKIYEAALGSEHPNVGIALHNLATHYESFRKFKEAEELYKRARKIYQTALGPDHPKVGMSLNNLAWMAYRRQDWAQASNFWRGATDLLIRRVKRAGAIGEKLTGKKKSEIATKYRYFHGLIRSVYREETAAKSLDQRGMEMFTTAQWALGSEAAGALAQMSARAAANDTELAKIIRERQDLVKEWQRRDKALVKSAALPQAKRNKKQESVNTKRLDEIDQRIAAIDKRLETYFPDYASLVKPVPLTVREVQALLAPDEALVLFLDLKKRKPTPEETFIWLVTREDASWVRSSIGTNQLNKMVKHLRCGLDMTGWNKEGGKKSACETITGKALDLSAYYTGKETLPFNTDIAHQLHQEFFGQFKEKIRGKNLLLVPSGSLTSLPFQVLLTEKPAEGAKHQEMSWLIKAHQLTVLPSVSSLKALRENARASKAPDPFIGVGNPLVMGATGKDKRAWDKQACAKTPKAENLQIVASRNAPKPISDYFRGGEVNLTLLKQLEPLPETADELCKVADTLGAQATSVYLGDKANETEIKQLSKSGALKQAKVIHFATHGFLAGETSQLIDNKAEPSLLLTPPVDATKDNDGLLLASEVAQLKLDADWVILSACNTAGAEKPGAEPMSGLAKAFFYAGARALLISHWNVNSAATVELITRSFSAHKQDPSLGRAGALRSAMLSLIRSDNMPHPEYWAPFIVVGEGALQIR